MTEQAPHHEHETSPLQGYFDWQVTTIMLAHDLHDPIPTGDETAAIERRQQVEQEVSELTLAIVPDIYKNDPDLDWPADLLRKITAHTLSRAAKIAAGNSNDEIRMTNP